MSTKKIIAISVAAVLLIAAVIDGLRYLKPGMENKQKIHQQDYFSVSSAKEIIFVYNAYGGIYPGIVDFVNEEFFPKSYPCNLCYQCLKLLLLSLVHRSCLSFIEYPPFSTRLVTCHCLNVHCSYD